MAGSHFLTLLHATSRSSFTKPPPRPFFYNTNKNYGEAMNGNRSRLIKERAPSTAEEFERVAEEKAKTTKMETQNVGGPLEGIIEEPKVESVFKEKKFGVDFNERG